MAKSIFIGVGWPYANGPLHVGHLAGAYLPADVFARYHRLKGNRVLMVSGSDCHGTPITLRAEDEGVTPQHLIGRYHRSFVKTFLRSQISFDWYTQTFSAHHHAAAQAFFLRLLERRHLSRRVVRAPYSASLGRFLPDRYVQGTCAACGFDAARGDQCDKCGRVHDAEELIDPISMLDHAPIGFRETEHFMIGLPELEGDLLDWLAAHPSADWRPNVLAFTRNWLNRGLKDRAITRDIEWGVPVPVPDRSFKTKRLYVWFDAVIGYLSASKEWATFQSDPDSWHQWWDTEAGDVQAYYFIGKDNIPFHTIIWPALLIAHGGLHLPDGVPANEFLNLEGRKMSTSQGWALGLPDIETRYDPDQLRYYLLANAPETRDANWSWEDFVRRSNDELVAVLGNLANRVLGIAWRNYGRVPPADNLTQEDRNLLDRIDRTFERVGAAIEAQRIREALRDAMTLAHNTNAYLARQEPWKLLKSNPGRAAEVIYSALQAVDNLSVLLSPFLPESSDRARHFLGHSEMIAGCGTEIPVNDELGARTVLSGTYASGARWKATRLPVGQVLREPGPLFKKLDPATVVEEELARLRAARSRD